MAERQQKYKQRGNILFLMPLITILFISITYYSEIEEVLAENEERQEEMVHEQDSKITVINHEQIVNLTDQFMNLILQDIDENYQVKKYQSKDELLDAFAEIAAREVAKPYVDFYFQEVGDEMYILPTEAPSWFMEENEYDMIQIADNKMKLVQDNYLEMYGSYSIEMEFTYEDKWKITEIKHLY